jgi:WD40 repeat protein
MTQLDELDVIVIGGQDRIIKIIALDGSLVKEFDSGHGNRIKDLAIITKGDNVLCCSCSSDGGVRIHDLKSGLMRNKYDAKVRLTCIGVVASN